MKIEVCHSPALYPFYENREAVVVVVDIFRATTTICTALHNGASAILSVASIEEARDYKLKGYLVGAERNVLRCDFADFGNSPFDYTSEAVGGKEVVFTTTNGTQAIEAASEAHALVIGAFINLQSVVDFCVNEQRDVVILCSGWNNRYNFEDTLFAGAMVSELKEHGFDARTDGAVSALMLWELSKEHPLKYIEQTEHFARLKQHQLDQQVDYCLTLNTLSILPILSNGKLISKY